MKFRSLGNSDILVSEIGFGLSQLSQNKKKYNYGYISEKEVEKIIRYAITKQINFFDTADTYGSTEKILGKLPKDIKEKIVISTKCGRQENSKRNFNINYVEKKFDESLDRIKSEKIDIYMLNKPKVSQVIQNNLLNFFYKQKKLGKITLSGIVVGNCADAEKFLNFNEIDCFSVLLNINEISCLDFINKAYAKNKGIIVRSPLNSGLLSGKINERTIFDENDERKKYFSKKIFESKIKKLKEIKKTLNIDDKKLKKFSLDFVLKNKNISSTLVGCSSLFQIKDIINYHLNTKYLTDKEYKNAINGINIISNRYNIPNQLN